MVSGGRVDHLSNGEAGIMDPMGVVPAQGRARGSGFRENVLSEDMSGPESAAARPGVLEIVVGIA